MIRKIKFLMREANSLKSLENNSLVDISLECQQLKIPNSIISHLFALWMKVKIWIFSLIEVIYCYTTHPSA